SGGPVGFGNIIFTGNPADLTLSGGAQSIDRWFNIDAGFNRVANQQLVANVRTAPLRYEEVRTDRINNVDLSIIKNTAIGRTTLQSRFATPNLFDHPLFAAPNTNPTAEACGTIRTSTQANYPRRRQVMVKVLFWRARPATTTPTRASSCAVRSAVPLSRYTEA